MFIPNSLIFPSPHPSLPATISSFSLWVSKGHSLHYSSLLVLHRFGQMYDYVHLSLWYVYMYLSLPLPQNPLCSAYSPSQHLSTHSQPATTGLFTVSIVLPFPECHIIGIMQYVTFSDWLLGKWDHRMCHANRDLKSAGRLRLHF